MKTTGSMTQSTDLTILQIHWGIDVPPTKPTVSMTLQEFHTIISDPDPTDGVHVHLKYLWEHNNAKSILEITGLDVSGIIGDRPVTGGVKVAELPIEEQVKIYASADHNFEEYKSRLNN